MKNLKPHLKLLGEMLDARKELLKANAYLFKALESAKDDRGSHDLIYGVIRDNQLLIKKLSNHFDEIVETATEK